MKKQLLSLFFIFVIFIYGCTTLLTKEYIPAMPINDSGEEVIEFYNWELEAPKMIAYKGTSKIEEVRDPNRFWTTLYIRTPFIKGVLLEEDVIIDSVYFEFHDNSDTVSRAPSRVAKFVDNGENYNYKVFNFFGNSGVTVPPNLTSLTMLFTAKIVDVNDEILNTKDFQIELFLSEKETNIPLIEPR